VNIGRFSHLKLCISLYILIIKLIFLILLRVVPYKSSGPSHKNNKKLIAVILINSSTGFEFVPINNISASPATAYFITNSVSHLGALDVINNNGWNALSMIIIVYSGSGETSSTIQHLSSVFSIKSVLSQLPPLVAAM
jgi:hypothetical protein